MCRPQAIRAAGRRPRDVLRQIGPPCSRCAASTGRGRPDARKGARTPRAIGRTPRPMRRTPRAIGRTVQPMRRTPPETAQDGHPGPMRRTPRPVPRTPRPMRRTPRGLGRTPRPVPRTPRPMRRTPRGIGRTPRPMGRTPRGMGRALRRVRRTPRPMGRTPRGMGRTPRPIRTVWVERRPARGPIDQGGPRSGRQRLGHRAEGPRIVQHQPVDGRRHEHLAAHREA